MKNIPKEETRRQPKTQRQKSDAERIKYLRNKQKEPEPGEERVKKGFLGVVSPCK